MTIDSAVSLLGGPALAVSPPVGGVPAVAPRAPAAAATNPTGPSSTSQPASAVGPSAVQTAVAAAAGSQSGLAGLLANLSLALASPLPSDVQAAAAQILEAQVALDPPPSAQALQQAIAGSGLFLEAQLAATGDPPAGDLKAALLNLVQALAGDSVADPAAATAPPPPPPPYAGGSLEGQPPAAATLAPEAALDLIAALLSKQARGALSRQLLQQAASLPKSGQTPSSQGGAQRPGASWLFELLFAAPDGPAVAQFEVDRDGDEPRTGAPDPIWRVRFSLNFAPIGPIHARISLGGGKAHVALWAENGDTRARLDAHQDDLIQAMHDDELFAEVSVFDGRPDTPPAAPGKFMNRAV